MTPAADQLNPYADSDGNPIEGKEMAFLSWNLEHPHAHELTPDERSWNQSIQDRMQSEQSE
ncbi:hypothetical protein ACO2Q8_04045 [Larkinella sp. VNQ87]